jgi:hypothetical protein
LQQARSRRIRTGAAEQQVPRLGLKSSLGMTVLVFFFAY